MSTPEIVEEIPTEDWEQAQVVKELRAAGVLFFAVPNGGSRNKVEAVRLQKQGVTSGVPDLVFPQADPRWRCLGVEMKRSKGGKVSDAQLSMHAKLRACGWRVEVCAGAQEALELLRAVGYL